MDEDTEATLHRAIQNLLENGISAGIPGIAANITSSHGPLFGSVTGHSSIELKSSLHTNHVHAIGSISKVFTSLVILQLLDEGRVKLEDRVGDLLNNEVWRGIPNAKGATIGQLLSHTGGVPSWEDDPTWIVEGRGRKLDPEKSWGKQACLEYIRYDLLKEDKALAANLEKLQTNYIFGLKSELMAERQRSVILYLVKTFGTPTPLKLDQTTNWLALRVMDVVVREPRAIELSVGDEVLKSNVDEQVFRNFKIFMKKPKEEMDLVFDRVTDQDLRTYLASYHTHLTLSTFSALVSPSDTPRAPIPSPGNFSYANTNFTFLGLIIEAITSSPADKEIRKRILTPLEMNHTFMEGFEPNPSPNLNLLPERYHWTTSTFKTKAGICPAFTIPPSRSDLINASKSNLSVEWTAGGYISSPTDLCILGQAIHDCDERIISKHSWDVMHDFVPATEGAKSWAGHGIMRFEKGGRLWEGHNGSVLGFCGTLYWCVDRDVDLVVSVLGNVGTMHCGDVTSAAHVGLSEPFLELAVQLAKLRVEQKGKGAAGT